MTGRATGAWPGLCWPGPWAFISQVYRHICQFYGDNRGRKAFKPICRIAIIMNYSLGMSPAAIQATAGAGAGIACVSGA